MCIRDRGDFAWRMQFNPWSFQEKAALFWHQLFATGYGKVDNPALMQKQLILFRTQGRARFGDLLLALSQDPAMLIWLDSVQNRVRPGTTDVANENYAREIMELYSLGVDNGYNQTDITNLARAFSGWTFTPLDIQVNPNNANDKKPSDGAFRIDTRYHATGSVTFLGRTFDLDTASRLGQDLVGAILTERPQQCAEFLAKRLLRFFAHPAPEAQVIRDLQADIQALGFDMGRIFKHLLGSAWLYGAANRHALYEGPVAWTVRMARLLGSPLPSAATATPLPAFPAWRLVAQPGFAGAGQSVLDPEGPNGWHEHEGWINSNTLRWRARLATALTLKETSGTLPLFPTDVATWFPVAPGTSRAVFDRLTALLQPAAIPTPVRDGWLASLWPASFLWDATGQQKARQLACLILTSPYAQLH